MKPVASPKIVWREIFKIFNMERGIPYLVNYIMFLPKLTKIVADKYELYFKNI